MRRSSAGDIASISAPLFVNQKLQVGDIPLSNDMDDVLNCYK